LIVLPFALACGLTTTTPAHREPSDGGASHSGGALNAGGAPDPAPRACDAPNAFPIWAKPYDAQRDCIDTENAIDIVACTLQPQEGDDPYYSDGFVCLQQRGTGKQVWVFAFNRVGFDADTWERCADAPLIAPKGCYAAGCAAAPRSSCSLAETKKQFACGAESEYDENCCGRQDCDEDSDCAEGEACREAESSGQWYCWDNPGNSCDCGGPAGGGPRRKCFAP